jgi:hypothetical protein
MAAYRAVAVHEGDFWVITAEAGGLHLGGQVERLEDAESLMCSLVAAALKIPEESVSVELDVR